MNELPAAWEKWSPRVIALLGVILGWLYAGIQNDPEWYSKLNLTTGAGSLIALVVSWGWAEYNRTKSAKAMPPAQIDPLTGKPFTREEQAINQAMLQARKNGNKELVAHLNASPITNLKIGQEEVAA